MRNGFFIRRLNVYLRGRQNLFRIINLVSERGVSSVCVAAKMRQNTEIERQRQTESIQTDRQTDRQRKSECSAFVNATIEFWNQLVQSKILTFAAPNNLKLAGVDTITVLPVH
jgi:predicted metalloprotease